VTRQIVLAGFLLRLGVAFWNSFFGPSPGADGDAIGLHEMAVTLSQQSSIGHVHSGYLYSVFLAQIYRVTAPSLFVGCAISCVAWLVSARILSKTATLAGLSDRQQAGALAVFAFTPSTLFWTSITIREPFQLLAVIVVMHAAVRIIVGSGLREWLVLLAATTLGAVMHAAILGWGLVFAMSAACVRLLKFRHLVTRQHLAVALPFLLIFIAGGYWVFRSVFEYPVDRGLAFAIESYQRGGLSIGVRTDYRSPVSLKDSLDLVISFPMFILQYLFEPMPWNVSSLADVEIVVENLVRFTLLLGAVGGLRRATAHQRPVLLVILIGWFLIESAFAVGTFNWGTAARHHIPGSGFLALLGFSGALPIRRTQSVPARGLAGAPA
jgi:hypothetical protein